jgi:hypothetical protein
MPLLFAVSVVCASPTAALRDADLSAGLSLTNIRTATFSSNDGIVKPVNVELANLAKEFLQPPGSSAGLSDLRSNSIKPLPAVPTTVLMLLTGFLCVSFYRDRKVWLTALVGLIWAGQAGLQAFPHLAMRISNKIHNRRQIRAELIYPYYLENSHRLRCDIEGTGYIGLLHHLAGIPDNISAYNIKARDGLITSTQNQRQLYGSSGTRPYKITHTTQPAVISKQYSLNLLFNCLASKAKQFICFSPAFIFDNLARGPPLVA